MICPILHRLLLLIILALPATWAGGTALADEALDVTSLLTGNFSNARQAAEDPAYQERVVRMTPIWTRRDDGPWLYMEESAVAAPDQPLRQRIYRLRWSPMAAGVEMEPHALPDPAAVVGAWRDPDRLKGLGPLLLRRQEGCAVILFRRQAWEYAGGTQANECASDQAGAAYVMTQMRVNARGLQIWDQHFDPAGRQVAGPEAGAYRFEKVTGKGAAGG